MSTIGERIKEERTIRKMTQQQFADSLGISRPHMSKIESNKENASESVLKLISQLYKIDYDWLQTGRDSIVFNIKDFEKNVERKHDLKIGETTYILIDMLQNKNVKNNSNRYYIDNIACILESMNNFFNRPDIEQCDSHDVEVISAYIEKKMLETLNAFKTDNLDN